MALVQLNSFYAWPGYTQPGSAAPGLATLATLDAAGEYQAFIFSAPQDMTISHVGWRTGAVVGSPTADTRVETVAADGTPSGTLWNSGTTNDSNIISGTLSSTTWTLHALTGSASVTKGQMVCIKIVYNSGTSLIVQTGNSPLPWASSGIPYYVTNTTGSAVKSRVTNPMLMALGSNTTTFYPIPNAYPGNAFTNSAFNNTNSAARGLRFKVPMPCRVAGLRTYVNAQVGDYNIVLYDDAGTELSSSSTALDGDHWGGSGGNGYAFFDSPVSLAKDTWYRAAVEPSSATNTSLSFITLPSLDYRSGTPGGTNHHYTTRASGSWTDTATDQVPMLDILIDQFDDGTSTGGAPGNGNMTGGLQ